MNGYWDRTPREGERTREPGMRQAMLARGHLVRDLPTDGSHFDPEGV